MDGKKLEEVMLDFIEGQFDILVATTIIESGLDVPNANTIIINNAQNFGLSDLHQMRGRVGRSNKKAYCYLITPPLSTLSDESRKRLRAIEEFSDLGSGFNIAMRDLDIRGAGDLLGAEQSGFINEIGFETYQKILAEAIEELKEKEFKELYETTDTEFKNRAFVKEVTIDTDFEILFPDDYVNNITERLNLYTKLNEIKDQAGLEAFQKTLEDRFGELPSQVISLFDSVRIKWIAIKMGIERVIIKQDRFIGYFISDQQSDFYQTQGFSKVLDFAQNNASKVKIKEKNTRGGLRLLLTIENVSSISKVLDMLEKTGL